MMNDLCCDIGYQSVNHIGEQLCGDHVEVIADADGASTVVVLADGLGSGVKANILSILTSKIISTMLSAGMRLEDAVETIAATLPICSERGVAYSTFTIIRIVANRRAEIIQYDNPALILLRSGEAADLPTTTLSIAGKTIYRSEIAIEENDLFVAFSDGVEHAGVGVKYNFGWKRADILDFVQMLWTAGYRTAKSLTSMVLAETNKLYDNKPGDDATVCCVRIRSREPVSLIIGPPSNRDDCDKMMSLFFAKQGKHIVCGGTTSKIAADYLKKPLVPSLDFFDPKIPPTATIEGVELVTEGVVTINRVLEYAQAFNRDNATLDDWAYGKDGASRIAQMLFEEATDINFFVGRAVNPAHQNPELPINFNIKMRLVDELAECLKQMGKRIKVSYF